MLNENRVYQMTKLAIYEKNQGARDEKTGNLFGSDYIAAHLLGSFFCATIAFAAIAIVVCVYNFENLMMLLYSEDLMGIVRSILKYFILFQAAFLLITAIVYLIRYRSAARGIRAYRKALKNLSDSYEEEDKR